MLNKFYYYFLSNNGCSVNHANAGNKCIGAAKPKNNSGAIISNGKAVESGP
jgi:hypothetical protein